MIFCSQQCLLMHGPMSSSSQASSTVPQNASPFSTLVLYHIPSDKDDSETPNAFRIPKPVESVTLADIRNHFPLPGSYHFRVKQGGCWVDLGSQQTHSNSVGSNHQEAAIPSYQGRIVLKVLRVSWSQQAKSHSSSQHAPSHQPEAMRQPLISQQQHMSPTSVKIAAQSDNLLFDHHQPANLGSKTQQTKIVDDFDAFFK